MANLVVGYFSLIVHLGSGTDVSVFAPVLLNSYVSE